MLNGAAERDKMSCGGGSAPLARSRPERSGWPYYLGASMQRLKCCTMVESVSSTCHRATNLARRSVHT
eukprot:475409-Prymnesium_polylepis.1